jgi:predicted AAA+ superfamily ATPase
MIKRHLQDIGFDPEIGRQLRFIAGPRQAGKTTLARHILVSGRSENLYFNWDSREVRTAYRKDAHFFESSLREKKPGRELPWICFDEMHKMPNWKNILKGIYDRFEAEVRFIVTGSARLDWFRRSGDSLAGRYFLFHLNPVSLSELAGHPHLPPAAGENSAAYMERVLSHHRAEASLLEQMLAFGGFPEPLLKADETFYRRWQNEMTDHLTREDVRDLTRIAAVENVAGIMQIIPERVGTPLSLNALAEDVETSHTSVRNAVRAMELTCALFLLSPYSARIARAVKKERKAYFFDWGRCPDPARRFENYAAVEWKTRIDLWRDRGLGNYELMYFRTRDGKETDFLITRDRKPWCLCEAKLQDESIARHHYLQARALGGIPFLQLVAKNGVYKKISPDMTVVSAARFFAA